jgi:hypothetical protein
VVSFSVGMSVGTAEEAVGCDAAARGRLVAEDESKSAAACGELWRKKGATDEMFLLEAGVGYPIEFRTLGVCD